MRCSWWVVVILWVVPSRAAGQWPNGVSVSDTPHNLVVPASNTTPEMNGRIRNYGEVCAYCHTPHEGAGWLGAPRSPLWNRPRPTASYRMPAFNEMRMLQDASPSDRARLCLSCHGGTVGLDAITNRPNTYTGPGPANSMIDDCEGCHSGGNPAAGLVVDGGEISPDQHLPIGRLHCQGMDSRASPTQSVQEVGIQPAVGMEPGNPVSG